jgi:hypothetical protein
MTINQYGKLAVVMSFLLMLPGTTRAVVVIDTFTTPQSASIFTGDRSTADGPGIIGGERDLVSFVLMSADGPVPNQLEIIALGFGGGDIIYDGNDNDPSSSPFNGMGSIDLTQGGLNDRFRFHFTAASPTPGTLTIDVKNSGIGSAVQVNLPQSSGILDVPFASFPSAAVFQTVGYINLHFAFHDQGLLTIDSILATVPEPTASALLLTAAIGLSFIRHRARSF